MESSRYQESACVEWQGHSNNEAIELSRRADGAYDCRHLVDSCWWDGDEPIDRAETGMTEAVAIDHCAGLIRRFEASMHPSKQASLLARLLSGVGIIDGWSSEQGDDFHWLAASAASKRDGEAIGAALVGCGATRRADPSLRI
jgi:hypothetical protein